MMVHSARRTAGLLELSKEMRLVCRGLMFPGAEFRRSRRMVECLYTSEMAVFPLVMLQDTPYLVAQEVWSLVVNYSAEKEECWHSHQISGPAGL